ncbi:NYN domain-containing protein [Bdellovibrionota bacterium FG-2]
MSKKFKTIVYIDGFNLYYGCLKGTPYRWLNLRTMVEKILPKNEIVQIKYFTAQVSGSVDDPDKPQRQLTYQRALKTIPNLEIYKGQFLSHPGWRPLADGGKMVRVMLTQEKGSDVNLATHVLADAFDRKFDAATIVSNDSDLKAPLVLVRDRFKKGVVWINPHSENPDSKPSGELNQVASIKRGVFEETLKVSQFSTEMSDAKGLFHKPKGW